MVEFIAQFIIRPIKAGDQHEKSTLFDCWAGRFRIFRPEQKIGIDDAQIAHVLVSANDVTVEASQLAGLKSSSEEVKALAHQVAREHSNVNQAVAELTTRLEAGTPGIARSARS